MKPSVDNSPLIEAILINCDVAPDIREEAEDLLISAMHVCERILKDYGRDPRNGKLGPVPFLMLHVMNLLNIVAMSPENKESSAIQASLSSVHFLLAECITSMCRKGNSTDNDTKESTEELDVSNMVIEKFDL